MFREGTKVNCSTSVVLATRFQKIIWYGRSTSARTPMAPSPNRKGARRQANPAIDGVVFLAGKGSQFKRGKVSSLWHALRMLYAARIRY